MSWQTFSLRDVIESIQSGFASGEKNVTDGFKHLRMNNIHSDGRLDLSLVRTVPQELATVKYRLRQDDVLVCTTNSGKLVGKSAMFGMEGNFAFSNHLTRLRVRRDIAQPAFVQKQLWFKWLHGEIEPLCKHWVNQSTLPKDALLGLDVSLPDIEQQRRIVARLDQVTARIDEAKARLDTIPATLKRFRQSILAAACSGRLTADWRISNGRDRGSWRSIPFGDVCLSSFYGPRFGRDEYVSDGIPTIRTTDMKPDGHIEMKPDIPRVKVTKARLADFILKKGDLLVTRTGSIGVMGLFESEAVAIPSAYLIRFRLTSEILPKFALFNLMSPEKQVALGLHTTAVTQPNINAPAIKSIEVSLPELDEQREIARRVEALFKQADAIEARYKTARALVEKLTPSVLAKAFRGELV